MASRPIARMLQLLDKIAAPSAASVFPRKFTPRTPGSTWIAFDPTSDGVPEVPAVYVVYLDGVVVYVGETTRLRSRLTAHGFSIRYSSLVHTRWGNASSVVVKAGMSRRYGDWRYREARLIRRLQPRGNNRGIEGKGEAG